MNMEVAAPTAKQHQQHLPSQLSKVSCGDDIFVFRSGESGEEAAAAAAVAPTAGINKFDLALPEKNSMTSNFTIRGFVSLVRKQDIRQTWPFSNQLLDRYLRDGKTLPQIETPPPSSVAAAGASGEDDDAGAVVTVVHPGEKELELQFHFENQDRDGSKGIEGAGEDSKRMEQESQLGACASDGLAAGQTGVEGEAKDKGLDCIEDKASDTGAEEVEAIQGSVREDDAGPFKPTPENEGVGEDGQQQNVCPVCASFSCHSVTALNAHIDGCLSALPSTDKCQRVVALRSSNNTGKGSSAAKVQKMRSITDIIAADPAPSPRSDSTAKHTEPVVRERRAPNHVVVLADKEAAASKSSSGQAQRNLRSRSRGSRSMILPIKPDAVERAARRRRRECTGNCVQKSGEWSEPHKKMRHCSGNSVEVTSSWTPSISSGNYCHSKAQDNVEKSCELSESHGSANCLDPSSLQPASVEQEKTPEKVKRSAWTGPVTVTGDSSSNKEDCEKPQEVEAPTQIDTSIDAPDTLPPPETQIPEGPSVPVVVEGVADGGSADGSAERTKGTGPSSMEAAANTGRPLEDPAVVATAAVPTASQSENAVQPPKSIPLYDSLISSLRSTSVDSLTGYSHFNNPTWKAAVVMATLGASLAKTSSSPSTPASVVTSIGNSDAAPRVDLCSQASDSICVSVLPVVEASPKPGSYNRESQTTEAKATASDRVAFKETTMPTVPGYFQALPGRVTALDKKYLFQNVSHAPEAAQSSATKISKVPGWIHAGDRPTVIDVDQVSFKAQASSSDAKAEKPVLRLLGQNVMVESAYKDVQGAKSPYSFSVPGVHAAGTGYHTPCCCSSRSAEHITFALGKDMSVPYTSNGSISQIPLPGTWRLLPNGILSQVNGNQISLGSAKLGSAPLVNCCLHKSCSQQHQPQQHQQQQQQPQQQQSQKARPGGSDQKNAGDLPPWLLAAKKQKEAEANVIVIDDDDVEEEKVSPQSVSKAAASGGASPSAGDVEFTGERSVRLGDKATLARHAYAPGSTSSSSHKREAGGDWIQQPHEKAAKITTGDSPQVANRMGIPVLVPTWMIAPSDSSGSVNLSKRGATAQTYKARIAMMKAFMHGSSDATPAQIHHQQRNLPPGACLYQASSQPQGTPRVIQLQAPLSGGGGGGGGGGNGGGDLPGGYIMHGGGGLGQNHHHHQHHLYQQQQQLSLLLGKDCQIFQLEDGQCLLVNGHMMEAEEQQQQQQQQQMVTVAAAAESAAAVAAAAAAAESMALGKRLVRDASGRSYVLCNDGSGHEGGGGSSSSGAGGGESGAKILVTPVLQGDSSGYHGIVLAAPGTSTSTEHQHHHHHGSSGHHHQHHQQIAAAAPPHNAVLPLSIVQQQQQQQIKILQSQMRAADKGVMCSWSYGQKS